VFGLFSCLLLFGVIMNHQRENGHVDIANTLIEELMKIHLSGREWQILMVIFRQTWGYCELKEGKPYKDKYGFWVKKKMDRISQSEFENFTGIDRRKVWWVLNELFKKNIIKKTIAKKGVYKRKGIKEKIQKKISHTFEKCEVVYQLTTYLEGKIRENNSSIKERTGLQIQSWCKDIDKLLRIDKANPDEVKQIIDWVVEDDFWNSNILSANKLRKHYSRFYKKVIDRGKSLDEQIKNDHRFDDIPEEEEGLLD
jgi:hypothetical protein